MLLDCEGGRKGARAASPPRPRPTNAHAHFTFPSDLLAIVQVGVVVCLLYAALVAATGTPFLPPTGAWWTVLLIWAAAHAGGLLLSRAVPIMPPLLGMLAAGVVLRNVPGGVVDGLNYKAAANIRYACVEEGGRRGVGRGRRSVPRSPFYLLNTYPWESGSSARRRSPRRAG